MDVFIGIDNIQYIGEHMIKMKATWYVLGSESWWPVSNTAKLELTKEQLEGWYQYVPPKDYKYG